MQEANVTASAKGTLTRTGDHNRLEVFAQGKLVRKVGKRGPMLQPQRIEALRSIEGQPGNAVVLNMKIKHAGLLTRQRRYRDWFDCWRKLTCSTLPSE